MEKILFGYLSTDLIKKYPSGFNVDSFFDYAANKVSIEGFLSVAGVLCPDFIEKDDYIFLRENYEIYKKYGSNTPYGSDKRTVERFVNLFSLSDFFYETDDNKQTYLLLPNNDNTILYKEFAKILNIFWLRRLLELFPDRKFIVEISENGILEEDGVCITFYEDL